MIYSEKDIKWDVGSGNDFTAKIKHKGVLYTLRVEQMDKESWWVALNIKEKNTPEHGIHTYPFLKTEEKAKKIVIEMLNKEL